MTGIAASVDYLAHNPARISLDLWLKLPVNSTVSEWESGNGCRWLPNLCTLIRVDSDDDQVANGFELWNFVIIRGRSVH